MTINNGVNGGAMYWMRKEGEDRGMEDHDQEISLRYVKLKIPTTHLRGGDREAYVM